MKILLPVRDPKVLLGNSVDRGGITQSLAQRVLQGHLLHKDGLIAFPVNPVRFVLIDAPEINVLAYYTLSSYTVDISVLDEAFAKRLPRYPLLPATLLGRLAVDNSQKGKRFGELMLVDALNKSLDATTQVASVAVIAEVLDEEALKNFLRILEFS